MKTVKLKINDREVEVPEGSTILEAARKVNIEIPTLCYLKGINQIGACRMCLVEVKGARTLQAACVYPVSEGLEVWTNTPKIRQARKINLELILSNHETNCLTCIRNGKCELQELAESFGVDKIRFEGENIKRPLDESTVSIVRDPNKCILCRRCVATCMNVQGVGAIGVTERGFKSIVEPAFNKGLDNVSCVNCGQCIVNCPVGAIYEKSDTEKVWNALNNSKMHVIAQTAPAVRVALGEEFDMDIGTNVKGKMVAALKRMGFDKVYDTNFAADLTIMEEGNELINRIKNDGKLPLITSCSPGWVKYCEYFYPEFLDNLSSCKSPHEMMGAVLKSYYAEKNDIDPSKIFVVSVMPCTAKKFEAVRPELSAVGYPDVDAVITTRELARMIRESGIDFKALPDEQFDPVFGDSTGAAVIFGATGGVMEAALRTVSEILSGKPLDSVDITDVRGLEGVREAVISAGSMEIKAAVAHGLCNARKLLDMVKAGERQYHFIEIMACPGGCINGGGQPIVKANVRLQKNYIKLRAQAIYEEDRNLPIRKSHENPSIKKLYDEYLGEPNSHKAHQLLHTHYIPREKYC
ncbi:MAG: iron hydrogenase small subunit [Firmicutes bacterium]|nr:iron hydrogenase small subunit [Bacillota bacterium]